jgi:hypothetical protein
MPKSGRIHSPPLECLDDEHADERRGAGEGDDDEDQRLHGDAEGIAAAERALVQAGRDRVGHLQVQDLEQGEREDEIQRGEGEVHPGIRGDPVGEARAGDSRTRHEQQHRDAEADEREAGDDRDHVDQGHLRGLRGVLTGLVREEADGDGDHGEDAGGCQRCQAEQERVEQEAGEVLLRDGFLRAAGGFLYRRFLRGWLHDGRRPRTWVRVRGVDFGAPATTLSVVSKAISFGGRQLVSVQACA